MRWVRWLHRWWVRVVAALVFLTAAGGGWQMVWASITTTLPPRPSNALLFGQSLGWWGGLVLAVLGILGAALVLAEPLWRRFLPPRWLGEDAISDQRVAARESPATLTIENLLHGLRDLSYSWQEPDFDQLRQLDKFAKSELVGGNLLKYEQLAPLPNVDKDGLDSYGHQVFDEFEVAARFSQAVSERRAVLQDMLAGQAPSLTVGRGQRGTLQVMNQGAVTARRCHIQLASITYDAPSDPDLDHCSATGDILLPQDLFWTQQPNEPRKTETDIMPGATRIAEFMHGDDAKDVGILTSQEPFTIPVRDYWVSLTVACENGAGFDYRVRITRMLKGVALKRDTTD